MRIVVSGTHFSGKTTLINAISTKLRDYEIVEEPYAVLEESGYDFSDPPSIEDFKQQLKCSTELIMNSPKKAIFDRSPIDFLAYALVKAEEDHDQCDMESWQTKIETAISEIDILVFLPIEYPDAIQLPKSEDQKLRSLVDEKLKELILDDSLGFLKDTDVLEVSGSLQNRINLILKFLENYGM